MKMEKEETTKVSIIIPIYNVEKYVKTALKSAREQTYENLEIICVNDGSNDKSMEMAHEIGEHDERIKWLEYKENHGLSYVRNRGLEQATGEYVLFLDSDDYLVSDAIQQLLSIAENNSSDVVLYKLEYKYENPKLEEKYPKVEYDFGEYANRTYTGLELLDIWGKRGWPAITSCTGLFSMSFLKNRNICFAEGIIHEDVLFINECIMASKKVSFCNRSLYVYVRREQSITTRQIDDKNIKSFFIIAYNMVDFFLKNDFPKQYYTHIAQRIAAYIKRPYLCYRKSKLNKSLEEIVFENDTYEKLFMLYAKWYEDYSQINILPEEFEKIRESKNIIVYGAGVIGRLAVKYLSDADIERFKVAVTNAGKDQYFFGNKVYSIDELKGLKKDETIVLLAVNAANQPGIIKTLHNMEFYNIIALG